MQSTRANNLVFAMMNLARARAIVLDMAQFVDDPRLPEALRNKCAELRDNALAIAEHCEREME